MAFTGFDKAATSGAPPPYRIGVEILVPDETYGDSWVDINKPAQAAGQYTDQSARDVWVNRLLKSPTLTQKSEVRPGRFATSISSLRLKDHDGIFGTALPWTFYIDDGSAVLSVSLASWYRAKVRIVLNHHATGTATQSVLGVFLIEDIQRDPATRTATIALVGLEQILMDTNALDVRRGDAWLTNVRLPSLVEELVVRGARGKIELAAGFPTNTQITSTVSRAVSPLGNLPVKDPDGNWNEKTDFCVRHMFNGTTGNASVLYFCGYSVSQNYPLLMRWDRATDTWTETSRQGSLGYEFVFGAQEATGAKELALVMITNRTGNHGASSTYNLETTLEKFNPDTLATISSLVSVAGVHMPQQCLHFSKLQFTYQIWGQWSAETADKDNISVPFDSVPFCPAADASWAGGVWWASYTDDASDVILTSSDSRVAAPTSSAKTHDERFANHLSSGYAHARMGTPWPTTKFPLATWSMTGAHDAFRFDWVRGEISWIWFNRISDSDGQWAIVKWDISTNTLSSANILFGGIDDGKMSSYGLHNITAFDLRSTSASNGKIWIAVEHHPEDTVNPDAAYLYEFSYGTGTLSSPTRISDNFPTDHDLTYAVDDRRAATIRSIRHSNIGSGYPLMGCCFNRYAASGHCYGLWKYDGSNSFDYSGVFGTPDEGVFPISTMPFEVSTLQETFGQSLDIHTFVQDQSNGQLWDIQNETPIVIALAASGETIDAENTWASSNLLWDTYSISGEDGRLYGCSASGPPADTQEAIKFWGEYSNRPQLGTNTPPGRLTLWQYSFNVSDILPVADFGDASVWDALEMCRQIAGDYIMGINQDGDFFFKIRPTSGGAAIVRERGNEFATPGTDILCDALSGTLDHKNIINSVTLPAWIGTREPPTAEVVLVPRNRKTSADKAVSISAVQTSNNAQRIVLDCLRSGYVVQGEDGFNNVTEPLLFSWRSVLPDLQTSLSVAKPSHSYSVQVFGLREGTDGETFLGNAAIHARDFTSGEAGDFIQVEGGNIRTITNVVPASRTIGLSGTIGPAGLTYPIGAAVRITPRASSIYSNSAFGICHVKQEFYVPGNEKRTLTVNSTAQLAPGVLLYRDTAYVSVVKVLSSTQVTVVGGRIGSGIGLVDVWPVGTLLKGAIFFETQNRAQAIGGTGVSMSIASPAFNVKKSGLFIPGDKIIINCEGFIAKEIKHGMTRSVSDTSIDRYGRKEWKPSIKNRLMTPARGRMYLEAISTWADPHWMLTATNCPMLTSTDIGTVYVASHDWLLIGETSNQVNAVVTGITRDLETSTMKLSLRGTGAATRSADTTEELRAPRRWRRWKASRWKLGRF